MIHPARAMPFATLYDGLQAARVERFVGEGVGHDGLRIYCYTDHCVYEKRWTPFTTVARGLILDVEEKRVVATPFPKFWNVGERPDIALPDEPFETLEKLDGSLIILFHHRGTWRTATKGSLGSDQARWAARWLADHDLSRLEPGTTYLAEAIYPENRIVVHYDHAGLVLLGAYAGDGVEVPYDDLLGVAASLGWRTATRHHYTSMAELLALARALPATQEGFVVRFAGGLRVKLKGDEYCRIHRLVSRVTPLALWDAMWQGDDLIALRRQLPEEFWGDFDAIIRLLSARLGAILDSVRLVAESVADLDDRAVGLRLGSLPEAVRRFIFPYRKQGGRLLVGRARDLLFRAIRPDGNRLDGYMPSSSLHAATAE